MKNQEGLEDAPQTECAPKQAHLQQIRAGGEERQWGLSRWLGGASPRNLPAEATCPWEPGTATGPSQEQPPAPSCPFQRRWPPNPRSFHASARSLQHRPPDRPWVGRGTSRPWRAPEVSPKCPPLPSLLRSGGEARMRSPRDLSLGAAHGGFRLLARLVPRHLWTPGRGCEPSVPGGCGMCPGSPL